ncbi:hypothetical protein V1478_001757 [Vespula squamosa]|uniref:Uncharacterized protein n=1 Tax=Vespula squamosa TaxID=30214 RepID=A0ABD2BY27_VESSQ
MADISTYIYFECINVHERVMLRAVACVAMPECMKIFCDRIVANKTIRESNARLHCSFAATTTVRQLWIDADERRMTHNHARYFTVSVNSVLNT